MDKIKNSDKFNSLKLNIKAASRDKTNATGKENPIKNITGIKVLKNHGQTLKSTFIRQSPRRHQETKKFDFSSLQFSNNSTNNKQQNITKSGQREETVRTGYSGLNFPNHSKNDKQQNLTKSGKHEETVRNGYSGLHFPNHSKNDKEQNLTKSGPHEESVRNGYSALNLPNFSKHDKQNLTKSGKHEETVRNNYSALHLPNLSKNDKQNLTKSGKHEETVRNNYRNFEPPPVPIQKPPAFVERLERDSSGFLKPAQPAPKKNEDLAEEEFKTFNILVRRLTDPTIFREVEMAYHCDKIFNFIRKATCKIMRKVKPNENTFLDSNIVKSLTLSSQGASALRMDTSRQSHLSNNCTSDVSKNSYLLRDWSVIKGSGQTELMVTGMLVDPWSKKVIEHNHRSSGIIEKSGNNCVRTVCCSYQLSGKFVEGEKRLPSVIKQYFMGDNFPDDWELVAAKWHSLNSLNSYTNRINMSCNNVHNKRSLEDPSCENNVNSAGVKKLKPNNNKRLHESNIRGREERSALNLSVQTRSAVRKNRLPIFFG
ncbi:hypothetical protein O3M35_000339 [Rhynocoris fuscipes]|uniref:SANTA domain-containing protein n=1 Tax=Rhynocoris fuscipes TaxID=488301 RepID=A0AAW1DM88_9HEMI